MKLAQRILAAAGLLVLSAGSARAADYHVVGKVLDAVPALAPYGVTRGAAVNVVWTVDLSTPVTTQSPAPDNKSDYTGALDFVIITIGTWQAVLVAPAIAGQNTISVADASNGPLDLLHIATPGTDDNLVLHGPAMGGVLVLSLDFYAPAGGASVNQSLAQDPNSYPIGVGSAIGAGGFVTFSLGDGKLPPGGGSSHPAAKCDTAQLTSASTMCLSQFKCHATYAKAPQKDPLGEKRDGCVAKAGKKFVTAYNKAAVAAASKGLTCGTTEPGSDVRAAITERVSDVANEPNSVTPDYAPLVSSWLTSAGVACAAGLKAEAANAAKPSANKLEKARAKTSSKLTTAAKSAVKLAVKKHVVFDPAPDVPAFVNYVDALIDATSDQLTGD